MGHCYVQMLLFGTTLLTLTDLYIKPYRSSNLFTLKMEDDI